MSLSCKKQPRQNASDATERVPLTDCEDGVEVEREREHGPLTNRGGSRNAETLAESDIMQQL